jgi:hypothetical protein
MRNGTVAAGVGLWALLLSLGACGEEGAPEPPPWPDDDGSTPEDDAGEDAEADGAEPEEDAGAPEPDAGELSQCEGDVLEFPAANAPGRAFSAAQSGNLTQLVYLVPSGGGSYGASTAQGLRHVSFETTGVASEPEDAANVGIASYAKTRDPTLVVRGTTLDLFYASNQDGPYELYHKELSAPDAEATRETTNTGRNEFVPVAARFGGELAVVYSDEPAQPSLPGAVAFKFAASAPAELTPESFGIRASRLAFAELGSGGAVAFLSELKDGAGIYMQSLAADGAPRGGPATLSEHIGGASGVSLARGRQGSAVVYTEVPSGTSHQLRFRNVDDEGQPSSTVRALTSANQDLRDIALATYSHGYVVAYRRMGGPESAQASIYLMFVDGEGNVGGTRLVRAATAGGRGIDVMVANDGRLIVIWSDTEQVTNPSTERVETELRVRAARLLCAL